VTRLILFDIDGTLLRTGDVVHQQALLDAIQMVFAVEASLEGVPLGGMLDSQIVRLTLQKYDVPPDDVRAGLPDVMLRMSARYRELLDGDNRRGWLLPGVEDLVDRASRDFILSVLTGNASGVARTKLELAGIDHYFPFGAYGDSADHRYELVPVAIEKMQEKHGVAPSPEDVVIVGDTPRDIEAARASGALAVGVATGRFSVDDLAGYEPDVLFSDLSDTDAVHRALTEMTAT
jgi:phosphoglycolate phosphatase